MGIGEEKGKARIREAVVGSKNLQLLLHANTKSCQLNIGLTAPQASQVANSLIQGTAETLYQRPGDTRPK